jgi:hypothetical protein
VSSEGWLCVLFAQGCLVEWFTVRDPPPPVLSPSESDSLHMDYVVILLFGEGLEGVSGKGPEKS